MQQHFELIPHSVQGGIIYQRPKDGYINATAMCQASGKQFKHWNENVPSPHSSVSAVLPPPRRAQS